jgi:hypothetical protein
MSEGLLIHIVVGHLGGASRNCEQTRRFRLGKKWPTPNETSHLSVSSRPERVLLVVRRKTAQTYISLTLGRQTNS